MKPNQVESSASRNRPSCEAASCGLDDKKEAELKKKLLAMLLSCCSVALALALVGCGGSSGAGDADSASAGDESSAASAASAEVTAEESSGEVIEIATAEDLAAINDNLSGQCPPTTFTIAA